MKKEKNILCLGDSFTKGFGVKKEQNWISLFNMPGINLINAGINGDTTSGMLARLKYHVEESSPDFILITGGINDFISGSGTDIPQNNYMSMIHQSAAWRVFPIIGIAPAFDCDNVRSDWASFCDFREVEKKHLALRKWLHSFAKTFHVPCLDFYEGLEKLSAENVKNTDESLYIDGIHMTARGHKLIAGIAEEKLKKLFTR